MIKLLSEFAPLMAFFIAYSYGAGIMKATLWILVTSIISIAILYYIDRKISKFSLISSTILLVSACITLITGNAIFIKIKPTILYLFVAGAFFISAIKKQPMIKHLVDGALKLKEDGWYGLSYRFAGFFILMAIINELVWRNTEEATWVQFKVFGALPITIIFVLLQIPFIIKNKLDD
jgi:intracellular septation protein